MVFNIVFGLVCIAAAVVLARHLIRQIQYSKEISLPEILVALVASFLIFMGVVSFAIAGEDDRGDCVDAGGQYTNGTCIIKE